MPYLLFEAVCALSLFLGMVLLLEADRWLGIRLSAHDAEGAAAGSRAVLVQPGGMLRRTVQDMRMGRITQHESLLVSSTPGSAWR